MLTDEEMQVCVFLTRGKGPAAIVRLSNLSLRRIENLRDWFFAERRLVWLQRIARTPGGRMELEAAGVGRGTIQGLRERDPRDRSDHLTDAELLQIDELAGPLS